MKVYSMTIISKGKWYLEKKYLEKIIFMKEIRSYRYF